MTYVVYLDFARGKLSYRGRRRRLCKKLTFPLKVGSLWHTVPPPRSQWAKPEVYPEHLPCPFSFSLCFNFFVSWYRTLCLVFHIADLSSGSVHYALQQTYCVL